jgi:hypothetical protein
MIARAAVHGNGKTIDGGHTEKRAAERVPILGDLEAEVMVFQGIAVTEVSTKGIRIESAFPLQLESLHDFRLTLGDRSVIVKGRIIHSAITEIDRDAVVYRSGVEFVEPSARVLAVIDEFVGSLSASRPQILGQS